MVVVLNSDSTSRHVPYLCWDEAHGYFQRTDSSRMFSLQNVSAVVTSLQKDVQVHFFDGDHCARRGTRTVSSSVAQNEE